MSVNYEKGNIVWVRLNGLWWPGEVCPEEQEAVQGKIPLAVVKFFNEDSYSYIFTPEQIHPYQCEFKKSLMKMSLTSTRIKADDLKKLKEDIITAEQLTGGNENILNDKDLYQKKAPKTNTIVEQLFGTPKKDTLKRKKKSNQNNSRFPITHKRFIMGFPDDYKEMVLIQSIGKDRIPDSDSEIEEKEMEEIRRLNGPKDVLKCQFCDLETINVDLLLMHTGRCYDNFKANNGKPKKSSSPKKTPASGKEKVPRKTKVKEKTAKKKTEKETPKKTPKKPAKPELNTSNDIDTIVNDWEDNELEESESSMKEDEEIEEKVEKKTKSKPVKQSVKKLPKKQQKPKEELNKTNDVESIAFEWDDNEKEEKEIVHETAETDKNDNKEKENCFNFDENEEDAPKSSPPMKKTTTDEPAKEKNSSNDDEFKQIMDTTQAPEISPEIKNLLKSQQNFPNAKTVKIPDKPQPSKSPTPIVTNPKKRILNNFEQQQLNKVPQKTKEDKETVNETVAVQKSPEVSFKELKEGIMSKLMTANTKRTRLGMHSIRPHAEEKEKEVKEKEKEKEKEVVTPTVVEEKPKVPCKSEMAPKRFFPSRQRKLTGSELVVKKEPIKVEIKEEKSQIEVKVEEEVKIDEKPAKSEEKLPEKVEDEVKKAESPEKVVVEESKCEDEKKDEPTKPVDNEIVFKSANKDSNDDFNISIKTNLTNLSKAEEMSAFTLATLSTNMLPADNKLPEKIIETPTEVTEPLIKPLPPPIDESELVPIEGNVTIVPEKVLADGEVELTANAQPTATLMNFSMDFSDSSNGTNKECVETPAVVKKPAKKSYERRELLEILEGNQEKKQPTPPPPPPPKEECDFDDMIPSQIITPKVKECDDQQNIAGEKSKLMERLTTPEKLIKVSRANSQKVVTLSTRTQFNTKPKSSKPIILSEEIIKPATNVKKRPIRDVDVEHLITKKMHTETKTGAGKAKILQQTIITPAGEIIQPVSQQTSSDDVAMFDFDSMPIILSDGTITPESLENMPVMLQNETTTAVTTVPSPAPRDKIIFKKQTPPIKQNKILGTQLVQQKGRQPRILHTMGGNKVQTPSNPKSKYVIVSQTPQQTKKQQCVIKKAPSELQQKLQEGATPSGNKVMILTNQQGVQQRLLLTPSQQQKYLGYQNANVKSVVKSGVQKAPTTPSTSGLIKRPSNLLKTQSSHQVVTPQLRTTKTLITKQSPAVQKVHQKPQKTIVIKDQQGHIVRKIQGNDDALLEQQVAEQIQAIKQQQLQQQQQQQQKSQPEILNYRAKTGFRRSYASKTKQQALIKPIVQQNVQKSDAPPPPLAPLSPEKKETVTTAVASTASTATESSTEKQLKQHIIQDSTGNLTSVTEGQILALQLDGESYMLVTFDDAGQLTPLNNEALTQLGPNLPSDLGNIVLQYQKEETTEESEKKLEENVEQQQEIQTNVEPPTTVTTTAEETVKCEVTEAPGGGQQLIVTGDPIAAQKFLESLTEGNTDFSNILANAEGGILIEHGGQQILINTDNQMILQENQQSAASEEQQSDEQKFQVQDILAAALADTGVQQEPNKMAQLSPNGGGNVFPPSSGGAQLSLSLNSPIMSSQEQPSTNNKKIADDETDILTQIPKNVDLPITITDPNISGKVAQQQQMNNIELNEISSPSSLVYSLPTLDDAVDLGGQKSFHNMPLLTEDVEEQTVVGEGKVKEAIGFDTNATAGVFMDEEGLCTLGGEMCNSLSEPPPDMFDIPTNSFIRTNEVTATVTATTTAEEQQSNQNVVHDNFVLSANDDEVQQQQMNSSEENSCEIPIQPEIVVSNLTSSDNSNNTFETNTITESIDDNSSNCKFD